jgi:hypothetical protein
MIQFFEKNYYFFYPFGQPTMASQRLKKYKNQKKIILILILLFCPQPQF